MWVFLQELSHGQKAYSPDDHTNCFILSQLMQGKALILLGIKSPSLQELLQAA